jgi:hypothetical protein
VFWGGSPAVTDPVLDALVFGRLQESPKPGCLGSGFSEFLAFHVHLPICPTIGKFDDAGLNGFFFPVPELSFEPPSNRMENGGDPGQNTRKPASTPQKNWHRGFLGSRLHALLFIHAFGVSAAGGIPWA